MAAAPLRARGKLAAAVSDNEYAMGLFARYSIYFAVYVASGIAVLATHYYQTSEYNQQTLDEQITLVAASHFALSQLVDNLPGLFRENSHAAALKISDMRGNFLGAMYDSRRMNAAEYKEFLNARTFGTGFSPVSGFIAHIWESKRRNLRIIALSLPRMQFSEYLARMSRQAYLNYIIPLFLLAGGLALFAFHALSGKAIRTVRSAPSNQVASPTLRGKSAAPPASKPRGHAWHLKPGVIADSAIREALQYLQQMAGAQCVSLFARSDKRSRAAWTGVTELRGSIIVRGESMDSAGIEQADPSATYAVKDQGKTWFFFDGEYAEATLCFCLKFDDAGQAADEELRQRIADFTRTRSRTLMAEHYYENSIIDPVTGLYSHPYAMFSLKERLLAGRSFATGILRFTGDGALIDARSARTAIRVMREHFAAEDAPVISRLDDTTLAIIFAPHSGKASPASTALRQLFSAYRTQGKHILGAFIEDTPSCGQTQRVFRMLETLLAQSQKTGEIAALKPQERLHIL